MPPPASDGAGFSLTGFLELKGTDEKAALKLTVLEVFPSPKLGGTLPLRIQSTPLLFPLKQKACVVVYQNQLLSVIL